MALSGEPPFPSTSGGDAASYSIYVSTLEERIDDRFLQENVVYFSFTVPFGRPRMHCSNRQEEDTTEGAVWEREVDEEEAKNPHTNKKAKASGKKRKSTEN